MLRPSKSFWIWLAKFAAIVVIVVVIGRLGIINATTVGRIFAHPVAAVAALLAIVAAIHISVMRWYLLLAIQGQTTPFWRLWSITFASYFIGSTTFGTLGVDAVRLYYIGRERPNSVGQAYLSIAVDRLTGLLGLVLVGVVLFAFNYTEISQHWEMVGFVLASGAIAAAILGVAAFFVGFDRFIAPIARRLRPLQRTTTHINLLVHNYRRALPTLAICILISVLVQALMLSSLVILTRALFEATISLPQLGLAGVMATIANQIPITPGGIALGEGAFAYLCRLIDPANLANDYGSVVFLQRLVALLATTPGLVCYIVFRRKTSGDPSKS